MQREVRVDGGHHVVEHDAETAGQLLERPDAERIAEIIEYLRSGYVLTKVRNSAGQDVDAGCGQLRARAEGVAKPGVSRPGASCARELLPLADASNIDLSVI